MKINFLQQRILIITKNVEVAQSLLMNFIQDMPSDMIIEYIQSKSSSRVILKGDICIEALGESSIKSKRAKYNKIYCDINISQEVQNNILKPLISSQYFTYININ